MKGLEALGERTRARLVELCDALKASLGDELVALIVYGSAARGEYHEGSSDVDLLVVLRSAARAKLEECGNALQLARFSARIEAIILTRAEIPRSADAFPLFYDDILRHHVLLGGDDPFAELVIHDRHRRLRIEQELREAQIRMRRAVVDATSTPGSLAGVILRKAKQVRAPLQALLLLKGRTPGELLAEVLAAACEAYGGEASTILAARERPEAAHDALVGLLAAAIADVDELEERP